MVRATPLKLSRTLDMEEVDKHRHFDCPHYERCLLHAWRWRSFSCSVCPVASAGFPSKVKAPVKTSTLLDDPRMVQNGRAIQVAAPKIRRMQAIRQLTEGLDARMSKLAGMAKTRWRKL